MTLRFTLNGRAVEAELAAPDQPLLYLLREEPFALNGPRFGCGLAQCGACTVLVDGRAVRSCSYPAEAVEGQPVTTLEGSARRRARTRSRRPSTRRARVSAATAPTA